MLKTDIAGLKLDFLSKAELLALLHQRIKNNQTTWLTTVYSEFLHAALEDPAVMEMLNKADVAVPDGIGIFWARKFLSLPLAAKAYYGKILQTLWQVNWTLLNVLFFKKNINTIPGSELVWDIAKLAADNNLSIYLLGGFGNTPKLAAQQLTSSKIHGREFLMRLVVAGFSAKNPDDNSVIDDIKKASPDILFVAYGPIKQEKWISEHITELPSVKLAVGLGGTFDYIAGVRKQPPRWIRSYGLEWLWRLFTQPHRYKRIYNAFFGLISSVAKYKFFESLPPPKN